MIEKYLLTQSGYFTLSTTVVLGMGITYRKLLLCHGSSEGSVGKQILIKDYNNKTFYECFDNQFPGDCGSPALNIPPITVYDRHRSHKRARYTPYLLPDTIFFASENSISPLTTPSDYKRLLLLPSNDTNSPHAMNKDGPYRGRVKRGYCSRKHDEKDI